MKAFRARTGLNRKEDSLRPAEQRCRHHCSDRSGRNRRHVDVPSISRWAVTGSPSRYRIENSTSSCRNWKDRRPTLGKPGRRLRRRLAEAGATERAGPSWGSTAFRAIGRPFLIGRALDHRCRRGGRPVERVRKRRLTSPVPAHPHRHAHSRTPPTRGPRVSVLSRYARSLSAGVVFNAVEAQRP